MFGLLNNRPAVLVLALSLATCAPALAQDVYWTDNSSLCSSGGPPMGGSIRRTSVGAQVTGVLISTTSSAPQGVTLNPAANLMYWAEAGKVRRATLSGLSAQDLITGEQVQDVKVDVAGGKLYWHNFNNIRRSNLDGSGRETIASGLLGGNSLALDLIHGKVYFNALNVLPRRIDRCNLDGTSPENVLTFSTPGFIAVAYADGVNGKLYWTTDSPATLRRNDLGGANPETLPVGGTPRDAAVDAAQGKLYWSDSTFGAYRIRRANLDLSNTEDVATNLPSVGRITLDVTHNSICRQGDMNCDGVIDGNDVQEFVAKLLAG